MSKNSGKSGEYTHFVAETARIVEEDPRLAMQLRKCPRCELNYITPREKYCKVCLREMRGSSRRDETELCSICNEQPALPGRDVCLFCQKEINSGRALDRELPPEEQQELSVDQVSLGDMEGVSAMDEIIPDLGDEMQDKEFGDMANQLSLEDVREEEESKAEEEEREDGEEE